MNKPQTNSNQPTRHPEMASQSGRPWRQIASGLLGGAIVLATVLGSLILAMQEAPPSGPAVVPPTATFPSRVTTVPGLTTESPSEPTTMPAITCTPPSGWAAYTVQAGDTLSHIASTVGTTVFNLIQGNCLSETDLTVGQVIYVPPTPTRGPTSVPTRCGPPSGWVKYFVQPGDTLYGLSVRYQTTVHALALANCLTTYTLRVGQPLYVPPVATSTPTIPLPTPTLVEPTAPISPLPTPTLQPAFTPPPTPKSLPTPVLDTATPTLVPLQTSTSTWTPPPTETLLPTSTPILPTDTPASSPTPTP